MSCCKMTGSVIVSHTNQANRDASCEYAQCPVGLTVAFYSFAFSLDDVNDEIIYDTVVYFFIWTLV